MTRIQVPRIENRYACIATDRQIALAATVSSCFCGHGSYFVLLRFPTIDTPYSPVIDYDRDDVLAQVQGTRAAYWINNCLARVQPDRVLLLGLSLAEQSYLRPHIPKGLLIEANTLDELVQHDPFFRSTRDFVACKSSELAEGLLMAKLSARRLVIDESAEPLTKHNYHGGDGLVVIESDGSLEDTIAVNYTASIGADAVLVESFDRHELRDLPRALQDWSNDRSSRAFDGLRRQITNRIKGIDFSAYRFVTFYTVGLPYGLVIGNEPPCTHLLKGLTTGLFIANSIVAEDTVTRFGSGLVFSPQLFLSEETNEVARMLEANHYTVTPLLGQNASSASLSDYGQLFPYDVLHICSHGGETDGYYVTQHFTDRTGTTHKLEFFEVVGFTPADEGMVKVESKCIFVALDDIRWMSRELKSYPGYIFKDLLKALKPSADGVVRERVKKPIALSCHIRCVDSIHQGAFQSLAGVSHPVVFNNTCSSSHEMAASFIAAGARAYVGTLWAIDNSVAIEAANTFYKAALSGGTILNGFAAMNAHVRDKRHSNIYILWGLHFSCLHRPAGKSDAGVSLALAQTLRQLVEAIRKTDDPKGKRRLVADARFVRNEILRLAASEHLSAVDGADAEEEGRLLEAECTEEEADVDGRNLPEFIVGTELRLSRGNGL